ncbi:MAG: hypothetical protein IJB38_02405 [Bacteroidales bacterium]|nr:hypothetical protein [Bacteroidales bacterium]
MDKNPKYISLSEVADILASLQITSVQVREVQDAVRSSSENGYDEEYTMKNLFSAPGTGVGDVASKSSSEYELPLSRMIEEKLHKMAASSTKSSVSSTLDRLGVDGFLQALEDSDIQIYWPFNERHGSEDLPIITFDPEDGSEVNIGYRIVDNGDGFRQVEEVIVDEAMAEEFPVWVVNRNSDAEHTSLEMLRREDPDWGEGGGNIIIKPKSASGQSRSLILKDFKMNRNYDTWFAGASEFFVKVGAVEDFTASTEAELRLYTPAVTDFMIVVKRSQKGQPLPFNAVLVSDWSDQMTHCAFMITEDDGGTMTTWDCKALVRVASKSYGVEIKIPFNSRDDIVWRGQLAASWLEGNSDLAAHFGDVEATFDVVEY